jgi:hypothetical protein
MEYGDFNLLGQKTCFARYFYLSLYVTNIHMLLLSVFVGTELKVYLFFLKGFVFCYIFMPEDTFIKAKICILDDRICCLKIYL